MTKLTAKQIDDIESLLGISLPAAYRQILIDVGYGEFGGVPASVSKSTKEIYHPDTIHELYEPFFDDPGQLFSPYVPFGCNNDSQEIWAINLDKDVVASISHETVPEDWPEEQWVSFDQWAAKNLDGLGI
jgi:hypothetical protein